MEPARILVVEDETLVGEELRHRLTGLGLTVDGPIRGGTQAITRAMDCAPDLVLMDIRLADAVDGIAAASVIRSQYDIPIVFLSAYSDDATIARAEQTGPFAFLPKPASQRQLEATIAMALHRHRLDRVANKVRTSRVRALRDQTSRDSLTLAWNRTMIVKILEEQVARAKREQSSVATVMIDVDRLTGINDEYGRPGGDAVLREAACRMHRVVRRDDALGRYGDDQFMLVLSSPHRVHTGRAAARLREAVTLSPIDIEGAPVAVSISLGACASEAGVSLDAATLVELAERDLQAAKSARCQPVAAGRIPDLAMLKAVQAEFSEMPGLSLTASQARRLWSMDAAECEAVFAALQKSNFLTTTRRGTFVRS